MLLSPPLELASSGFGDMQMQLLPQHQLPSQKLGCGVATHSMQALQQQHQQCAQVLVQQLAAGLTGLPQQQTQLDRGRTITPTAQSRQLDDAAASSQAQMQKTPPVVLVSDAAGGTAGQPSSATSSETRAAADWSPEHAGQHSDRNSEEPVQQASAAAMVQPVGVSGSSHGRCPTIKEHHHHYQQQHLARYVQQQQEPSQQPGQQHNGGQMLHIQQHLAAAPKLQGQQQQQQQQFVTDVQGSRPWGWWRAAAAPNMWQALDLLRQPLLQAHSLLGCSASSQQLLGLMSPQADTAAAAAAVEGSSSNVQFSECWRLLQMHAQLAQQAKQQQQQRLLQQQEAQPAAGHAACVEVPQVQQQQQQQAFKSLLPPPKQQQQQQELESAQPKRRAAAAAVTVAAAVDSSKQCRSKQSSAEASTVPPAVQQQQQRQVQKKPAAAAARPPVPKPPKKPWQPKMAPDDRNWNKVGWGGAWVHMRV
jgi:hypothetical protein